MTFLYRSSYILLLFFITFSCKLEKEALDEGVSNITDIAKAKQWFEENEANLSSLCCKEPSLKTNFEDVSKKPDWNKAMVHQQTNGIKVIEVKLDYDNYLLFSNHQNPVFPARPNVLNSLMLLELAPDKYGVYLLKTFPEDPYMPLGQADFERINFGKISNGFSGSMLIFDWNENFIGGWEIQNGLKNKHIIRPAQNKKAAKAAYKNESIQEPSSYLKTDFYSLVCSNGECQEPVLIKSAITYLKDYSFK